MNKNLHKRMQSNVKRECGGDINQESFKILYKINKNKGLMHIRTAEALFIRSNKPSLNNKDEFRSRK